MRISVLWIGLIASLVISSCAEREVGAAKLANYVERLSTAADVEIGIVERGQNLLQRVDQQVLPLRQRYEYPYLECLS